MIPGLTKPKITDSDSWWTGRKRIMTFASYQDALTYWHSGGKHHPEYKYDCGHCKFNWCCGYTCACHLKDVPEPPQWLQKSLKVIHELVDENFKLRNK